jgi:hypothetical protein
MGVIYADQYGMTAVGLVDEQGLIHKDQWGGTALGRVDQDGVVYDDPYGGQRLGHVDNQGQVFREGDYQPLGTVGADGTIKDKDGYTTLGRAEAPHVQWSGAAFLLLLR